MQMTTGSLPVAVGLEMGPARKVFAQALDWPGWCRAGRRTESDALDALLEVADRYALVADRAGVRFDPPGSVGDLVVAERIAGSATTDFGAPARLLDADRAPLRPDERERWIALLAACWDAFDEAYARCPGDERAVKPPVGRSPDAVRHHLLQTDVLHRSAFGAPHREVPQDPQELDETQPAVRSRLLAEFATAPIGVPLLPVRKAGFEWTPRFALRRSAWHALDHAWELEDRLGVERRVGVGVR